MFNWGRGRDEKGKTNDTAPALLLFVGDSEAGGFVYLIDGFIQQSLEYRYLEAIQTCTLLLSSLFDEAERGDSFTTRATPEVLSETVWFNDFQPT